MRWKTICFDLDNTLINYEMAFEQTMKAVFKSYSGYFGNGTVNLTEWFPVFKMHCDQLWEQYEKGIWTRQEYRFQRLQKSLAEFNMSVTRQLSEDFYQRFEDNIHLFTKPFPGVGEFFQYLHSRNIVTGIITNGKASVQRNKLDSLGLNSFIGDNIFISEEVGVSKPNPKIFDLVKEKMNCREKPLYIGDNYEQDILGAKNADWDAIYFRFGEEQTDYLNGIHVCSSYKDVMKVLG
jgi:5'-nucleotidase